ncbi:unnamed protein product [Camellia sinensis]
MKRDGRGHKKEKNRDGRPRCFGLSKPESFFSLSLPRLSLYIHRYTQVIASVNSTRKDVCFIVVLVFDRVNMDIHLLVLCSRNARACVLEFWFGCGASDEAFTKKIVCILIDFFGSWHVCSYLCSLLPSDLAPLEGGSHLHLIDGR